MNGVRGAIAVFMKAILKRSPEAVSPVVAEILLVAITVVLAATIYIMASGMLNSNADIPPVVAFTGIHSYPMGSYNTSFSVADASANRGIVNYRFNLRVGTVPGQPMAFAPSGTAANITVNGTTYRVTWLDLDGGGSLSQGDEFTVSGRGVSLQATTTFDFMLFTSKGQLVAHELWTTP